MKTKNLRPISLNQIGSFYNFPNWRYLIYLDPARANLEYCRRKPADGSQSLRRYMPMHEEIANNASVAFSFTTFLSNTISKLDMEQKDLFFKLFNKKLKLSGEKKMFTPSYKEKEEDVKVWSAKFIDLVLDKPLKKFLYHVTHIKYDADYDFAVKYYKSEAHQRNFCVIGYCIFAGVPDHVIAHRYRLYPRQVRAMHELFFDFTNTPTEVVARAAYFTQLSDNKIISDVDRRYYKIIGSLGELGLKADADPSSLTYDEKERLNLYLADSMIDNVTSLYFSIEDKKDALAYNTVINNLASFMIKKEEIKYFQAKVRNLDASTERIVNIRTDYDTGLQEDDEAAIKLISDMALLNNVLPAYKSIQELQ